MYHGSYVHSLNAADESGFSIRAVYHTFSRDPMVEYVNGVCQSVFTGLFCQVASVIVTG